MEDNQVARSALEVRVAVLEVIVATLRSEFSSIRTTIQTAAISIIGALFAMLIGSILYFVDLKDDALHEIKTIVAERNKVGGSNE